MRSCTATKNERAGTARKHARGAVRLVERLVGVDDVEDDSQIVRMQRRLLRPHVHARAPSPKKSIAYLKPTVHSVPAGDRLPIAKDRILVTWLVPL